MRIYAYELTWPGFKDVAIKKLIDAGCSHALEYYNQIVGEYEKEQEQTLKEVAHWYRNYRKEGGELWAQKYLNSLRQKNYLTQQGKNLKELKRLQTLI